MHPFALMRHDKIFIDLSLVTPYTDQYLPSFMLAVWYQHLTLIGLSLLQLMQCHVAPLQNSFYLYCPRSDLSSFKYQNIHH